MAISKRLGMAVFSWHGRAIEAELLPGKGGLSDARA
jgi:hypothetical protein